MKKGLWTYKVYTKQELFDYYDNSFSSRDLEKMEAQIFVNKLKEDAPVPPEGSKTVNVPSPGFFYLEGTCMEDIVLKEFKV